MGDLMKKENRSKLAWGSAGVGGGIAVISLTGIVAGQLFPALGIGALILFGGWKLFQKPKSALAGMVMMAAGILTAAAGIPLVGGLASFLMGLSGVGMLLAGGWTIYRVFKNRKS